MYALDKLFLKSQPLADRWRAVFHCKQTIGQKMSQLITEKENERFAANTADMTQDDFFVIAILEMCTDPELSKRFGEVKTDELTWEKFRDVVETYQRATASNNRAMMVNPIEEMGERTRAHKARARNNATDATGRATRRKTAEPTKRNSIANSAELKGTYLKPARRKKQRETATKNMGTHTKRDR